MAHGGYLCRRGHHRHLHRKAGGLPAYDGGLPQRRWSAGWAPKALSIPTGSSRCSKRTDSSSAGPLGVRRVLPPHPGVARRRAAPGKSTDELLPRATQIPFSWSAISKSARGAARRRNTLKSSSRKTWCSRTWANSARSSTPSMRPVPVALWTTSGAAMPPST